MEESKQFNNNKIKKKKKKKKKRLVSNLYLDRDWYDNVL